MRDCEAEDAKLRHLRNDLERDVAVRPMPLLCLRRDFAVGELADLFAHRRQRFVQSTVADGNLVMFPHQLDETGAVLDMALGERMQRAR